MAIIVVAASRQGTEIKSSLDLALSLQSVYGNFSKILIGFGLLAAGFTSALTAPLAAGLLAEGLLRLKHIKTAVVLLVLTTGFVFAYQSKRPIQLIMAAQYFNGIVLTVVSSILIYLAFVRLPEIYAMDKFRGWILIGVGVVIYLLALNLFIL